MKCKSKVKKPQKNRWLEKGRDPCGEQQIKVWMHYRESPRRMGGLSLQWELICCSCRRKAVSDCVLSVAHVQRIAHWFFTLPNGVPMNHCVCVCYMHSAFGFCLNQAKHLNNLTHNHLHTLTWTQPFSDTFPGSLISSIAITSGWMVLNLNLSRGLSGVLTNPQDTPRPPLPFLLLNAPVIATISHSTSLVRWLSPGPVAH